MTREEFDNLKVGDKVIHALGGIGVVTEKDENGYTVKDKGFDCGDVLYSLDSNRPFIYKERNGNEQAKVYCGINIYGKFFVGNTKDCIITTDKYITATKEQRDTLFARMKEAGYEWDAEKKELRKIEQKLASSAKVSKNGTLLDLLQKMPPFITVDGVDYYFVMRKTSFYTAYYKAIGEECSNNAIFALTAYSPIDLLTEMFKELKEEGLLE